MIPGWVFIVLGLVLVGVGGFLTIYGQWLLPQQSQQTQTSQPPVTLTPQQDRLLQILYDHQKLFGLRKLIVGRDGTLYFEEPERKGTHINLADELLGGPESARTHLPEFEAVMESMPDVYLKHLSETRYGNPFVVSVTEEGIRYLRAR